MIGPLSGRLNLRNKIMFSILPLVLVAFFVLAYFSLSSLKTGLKNEIKENIKYKTESLAAHAASWIRMQKLNMEVFSDDDLFFTATTDSVEGKAARKTANVGQ